MKKLLSFFIGCCLFFLIPAHAFDENEAIEQWNKVKDTPTEAKFLTELFVNENIPSPYPSLIKQRFQEIMTENDLIFLLDFLVDANQKDKRSFVFSLLQTIDNDTFVLLFGKYHNLTSDLDTRNILFNLITRYGTANAFDVAIGIIESLPDDSLENGLALLYLSYMTRFKQPELKQHIIEGTLSSSTLIRAACYVSLRNYPDDDVETIFAEALESESSINLRKQAKNSYNKLMLQLLEISQNVLNKNKHFPHKAKSQNLDNDLRTRRSVRNLTSQSSDSEIALKYAPILRLSGPGAIGVNIRSDNYPYTDYIPINVNDTISNPDKRINFVLSETVTYENKLYQANSYPLSSELLEIIGNPIFKKEANYLDFSPIWEGISTTLESGYESLIHHPTVYFKVFRSNTKSHPIAIQYWFFYFYNDWLNNHPGDWETITVFLNTNLEAVEAIYSTHYEANRHSWNNINTIDTHPQVFISNGGHGSYNHSGNTYYYSFIVNIANDNHLGDREILSPSSVQVSGSTQYTLLDLGEMEKNNDHWIWFEGRWGDDSSAPQGPMFRTDVPTETDYERALNPPRGLNCERRFNTNIYTPWYWASGYDLNGAECRFWTGNGSIISYYGKKTNKNIHNDYAFGIKYDSVMLHSKPHGYPVAFFQWQVSKNGCDRLKINAEYLPTDERNVDITFGKWSSRNNDITFKNVTLPFIIGENNINYIFQDDDKQWYVIGIQFQNPISKSTRLNASCTSEISTTRLPGTGEPIALQNGNYQWNGNASVISGMFTHLKNEELKEMAGTFWDVTKVHPSAKKPVVFFQWMASEVCPKLTIDSPELLEAEKNVQIVQKIWDQENFSVSFCKKLPCLLERQNKSGGPWNLIGVAFDNPVSQTATVRASCPGY